MGRAFKRCLVVLACLLANASAQAGNEERLNFAPQWTPWFEVGGYHTSRDEAGAGSFTGTIELNGVTLVDNVAPCN